MILIICILLIFQWKLSTLRYNLGEDCKEYYDINDTCPCESLSPRDYDINDSIIISNDSSVPFT